MTHDNRLTEGPVLKGILLFAAPIIFGNILQNLYNLIDTAIVGNLLGLESLAAVGSTGAVNFLVIGFVAGTCAGMTIPVAQQFGAGNHSRMRKFIYNAALLAVFFSLFMTPFMLMFAKQIMHLMNTPPEIIADAVTYISVIFAGIPVTFLYNIAAGVMRAMGDSRRPLYYLLVSTVINIFLDIITITVFKMGIRGPAIATVFSQLVSGLLCLRSIIMRMPDAVPYKEDRVLIPSMMGTLASVGTPMGLQYSITAIGSVILQSSVNSLGSQIVASFTVAGRINMMVGNTEMDGFGTAMATYVGQNYGARRYDRIISGVKQAHAAVAVYSVFALFVMYFFSGMAAGLFVADGPGKAAVVAYARRIDITIGTSYFMLGVLSILRFAIQSLGYSYVALLSGVAEMIARMLIGLTFIPRFGFTAACFSNTLAWFMADVTLLACWFAIIGKVRRKLVSPAPEFNQ